MNYKNPDFYKRSENFFPKKDNSAFLRRSLSKKYKEDSNKNFDIQDEINNEEELYEEENNDIYNNRYTNTKNIQSKSNYNRNFFQTYNTHQYNLNNRGAFYTKAKNENKNRQALLERMNNDNKNKYNVNKYFTTNIGDDNVYEEFIINYNPGMKPDENKLSNTIDRKRPHISMSNTNNTKNRIYIRVSLNNGIYKVDKKLINDLYNDNNNKEKIDYFNSTYHPNHPYQKRKILDFKEKEPIENGMPDRIKKELYFKNNRNNLTNYNFFDKRLKKNDYNYNFNTYNLDKNNYDRNYNYVKHNLNNYNNNTYENNFQYSITQKDFMNKNNKYLIQRNNNKNIEQKINLFLEHFSEYCIQYYNRIIKQLFSYLKNTNQNTTKKYNIITHKKIPIDKSNTNNFNLNIKNNLIPKSNNKLNNRNYIKKIKPVANTEEKTNENKNERIPYHKSTDLVIDRIRYNNQSKSPDKKNNFEMFRDIKELSKKYESINNRKSRKSFNGHLKKGNDLSFNADSVKRNKEKEKWEKTLEKEREMKRIKEKEKKENNKDLIYIQNNNENFDNKSVVDIRNKYKKLNNIKNKNNKNQMFIVKKLQTKDKKIHINIKYLNYYITNNSRGKYFFNNKKYKNLQKNNAFNITLFGIKNKNKKAKNENNNNNGNKKLTSIKEEKENKIELSLSDEAQENP